MPSLNNMLDVDDIADSLIKFCQNGVLDQKQTILESFSELVFDYLVKINKSKNLLDSSSDLKNGHLISAISRGYEVSTIDRGSKHWRKEFQDYRSAGIEMIRRIINDYNAELKTRSFEGRL